MPQREFSGLKDKKSAMDADASGATATAAPEKTTADEWKSHQQTVDRYSPNLYSVSEDPNETAITGDGYSITNGKVNACWSSEFQSALESKPSGTTETIEEKKLKPVEHKAPGLMLNAGATPTLENLVKEDPEGESVTEYQGTIKDPNIDKDISSKYLFTDEGPTQNDVKQVGIGDCYFWGAVLQILNNDPSKFTQMMKLNGQNVETTMYYKKGLKWVEAKVVRPVGIGGMNSQYTQNNFDGNESGVRVDVNNPCESAWNAVINDNACMINRTDYFKAALWANCLEQAYSDFSREHGKYGKGAEEKKDSGNEEFEGGCPDMCMHMFYGSNASNAHIVSASEGFLGITKHKILKSLVNYKKNLDGNGKYEALGARRTFGDPNTNEAHVYSVENLTFKNSKGDIIDFTDANNKEKMSDIDLSASTMVLRNPWNSTDEAEGKYFEITIQTFISDPQWTHLYRATISERTN